LNWFRRLYHWVLHWAETRYGVPALFVLALTEASVFPIPPDVLLMALCLGLPKRSFYFASLCSVGSVLGGILGYFIGFQFWTMVGEFFFAHIFSEGFFFRVRDLYSDNAFLSIFISGFTPIPYKVFTITAGVFKINFPVFVLASILGRSLRFFLVAALLFKFGTPIKRILEKYFELFTVLFVLVLVGGFVFVKYLLR